MPVREDYAPSIAWARRVFHFNNSVKRLIMTSGAATLIAKKHKKAFVPLHKIIRVTTTRNLGKACESVHIYPGGKADTRMHKACPKKEPSKRGGISRVRRLSSPDSRVPMRL